MSTRDNPIKKADLLKLPTRDWGITSSYDSLYVVPTGKKHDSGWMTMAIIGIRDGKPVEIDAHCDDIDWDISPANGGYSLRTDCEFPSGVIHIWRRGAKFEVGTSLSSTDVRVLQ